MDHKNWKLFRCIYDEMGRHFIEGEGDDDQFDSFEKCVEDGYGNIGWLIGIAIPCNSRSIVEVVLEGNKEVLEYVLELAKKS